MKNILILLFWVLAVTVQLSAATYYVAPNGDNDDAGTIDNPWRTISEAARTLEAGDTVLIREGTYRGAVNPANSGTEDEPIVYSAFQDERVVVNGTRVISDWDIDEGGVRYVAQVNFSAFPRFNSGRDPRGTRGGLLLQDGAKMNYAMAASPEEVDEPGEYYINDAQGQNPPYILYACVLQ